MPKFDENMRNNKKQKKHAEYIGIQLEYRNFPLMIKGKNTFKTKSTDSELKCIYMMHLYFEIILLSVSSKWLPSI